MSINDSNVIAKNGIDYITVVGEMYLLSEGDVADFYGDYMKFPPVKERGLWHSFVFQPDIPYKSIK